MDNKDYVSDIWHLKVDDNLDWEFCAEYLKGNGYADVKPDELERKFKEYFRDTVGIEPYSKCPLCGKELLPRESLYGYFIGCSGFPTCKFLASNTKPYKKD